jgi:hypothetical protein
MQRAFEASMGRGGSQDSGLPRLRHRARRVRLFAVPQPRWTGLVWILGATACGPSMQSLYEGDVRFEHCYRLDLDRETAPSHRHACWEQWVQTYSYGQSRDKIEYAKRRLRYLEAGETSPPELNVTSTSQANGSAPTSTAAHTDVHTPPPSVAPQEPAKQPASAAALVPRRQAGLPGQACARDCAGVFRDCLAPCAQPTASDPTRCNGCEQDYGRCMQRC